MTAPQSQCGLAVDCACMSTLVLIPVTFFVMASQVAPAQPPKLEEPQMGTKPEEADEEVSSIWYTDDTGRFCTGYTMSEANNAGIEAVFTSQQSSTSGGSKADVGWSYISISPSAVACTHSPTPSCLAVCPLEMLPFVRDYKNLLPQQQAQGAPLAARLGTVSCCSCSQPLMVHLTRQARSATHVVTLSSSNFSA